MNLQNDSTGLNSSIQETLVTYRNSLVKTKGSELNRLQKMLEGTR